LGILETLEWLDPESHNLAGDVLAPVTDVTQPFKVYFSAV
jgi:hypothetical protein